MAKTIKQIADELGISKQAVFKRIDNLGLRSKLTKIDNQLMVEKEQESMIKSAFSEKQPSTKPSTSLQLETVNDAVVDVLLNQSEMLKNELKIKNKQIEESRSIPNEEAVYLYFRFGRLLLGMVLFFCHGRLRNSNPFSDVLDVF